MVDPVRKFVNNAADTAVQVSIAGAAGYLCARVFTRLNAVHGATFAVIAALVFKVVNPIFAKFFAGEGANDSSKIIGIMLSLGTGVVAAAGISTAIGCPVTVTAGLVLVGSIFLLERITRVALAHSGIRVGGSVMV